LSLPNGKTDSLAYQFDNSLSDPLTLALDGNLYRPKQSYKTDMGSVPPSLQAIYPRWFAKDRYLDSFLLHDQSYAFKSIFEAVPGGWEKIILTRKQADKMLKQCILLEGGSRKNAWAIYIGVRLGGCFSWGKGEARAKHNPAT